MSRTSDNVSTRATFGSHSGTGLLNSGSAEMDQSCFGAGGAILLMVVGYGISIVGLIWMAVL